MAERAAIIFSDARRDLISKLGRAPSYSNLKSSRLQIEEAKDTWGYHHASGILISGRIVCVFRNPYFLNISV
jgi:hypothetical protein